LLPHACSHLRDIFLAAFALAAVHVERGVVPVQTLRKNGRCLASNFVQHLGQFKFQCLFKRAAAAAIQKSHISSLKPSDEI